MNASTWSAVARLAEWLDAESQAPPDVEKLLRVMKLGEEVGEVCEALHGVMGSNPRKGTSHTWEDAERELCDVILTGMVALATLTPDAARVFEQHLARVAQRSLTA